MGETSKRAWSLTLPLLVSLLVVSATMADDNQKTQPTISEVMTRITELIKYKAPHCEDRTMKDAYFTTQIKSLTDILIFQEGMMSDLRYMANKLSDNINGYLPESLRAHTSPVTNA
ncbi:putative SP-like 1 [Homarus americanus]|uniref:Putative SP-like 1 n=1 Tax=Homarus americanus TaxID=6706 RepID=A0A8J5JII2_HOMAM|nr:putative SP-like 1 [Homarus americanus]